MLEMFFQSLLNNLKPFCFSISAWVSSLPENDWLVSGRVVTVEMVVLSPFILGLESVSKATLLQAARLKDF